MTRQPGGETQKAYDFSGFHGCQLPFHEQKASKKSALDHATMSRCSGLAPVRIPTVEPEGRTWEVETESEPLKAVRGPLSHDRLALISLPAHLFGFGNGG